MIQDKIPLLIVGKVQELFPKLLSPISQIIEKTGISLDSISNAVQSPNEFLSSQTSNFKSKVPSCLPKAELDKIVKTRNLLINKLNSTAKIIETYSKVKDPLQKAVDTTDKGLSIAKTAVTVAETAITAIPPTIPIPGPLIVGLSKADKLVNTTIPPILTQAKNKVTSISEALGYANSSIFKLLNMIKLIDQYLKGCGVSSSDLSPTNDYINQVNQQYTDIQNKPNSEEIYNGFTLEIVEEPYSPTVMRRKAVAKNKNGIILLQTPLSFTTLNEVLINEIKLLIDTNNLKAD